MKLSFFQANIEGL